MIFVTHHRMPQSFPGQRITPCILPRSQLHRQSGLIIIGNRIYCFCDHLLLQQASIAVIDPEETLRTSHIIACIRILPCSFLLIASRHVFSPCFRILFRCFHHQFLREFQVHSVCTGSVNRYFLKDILRPESKQRDRPVIRYRNTVLRNLRIPPVIYHTRRIIVGCHIGEHPPCHNNIIGKYKVPVTDRADQLPRTISVLLPFQQVQSAPFQRVIIKINILHLLCRHIIGARIIGKGRAIAAAPAAFCGDQGGRRKRRAIVIRSLIDAQIPDLILCSSGAVPCDHTCIGTSGIRLI